MNFTLLSFQGMLVPLHLLNTVSIGGFFYAEEITRLFQVLLMYIPELNLNISP